MSTSPPPLDIVTVSVAIAGAFFGAEVAAVIGPYAVIVLGALLGAAWSATRRDAETRTSALGHVVLMIGWALIVTVPLAIIGGQFFGLESKWLLGPVAVVIAGIGQDWPAVGKWGLGLARAALERFFQRKGEGKP